MCVCVCVCVCVLIILIILFFRIYLKGCGSGLVGKMLRREGFIGYLAGCDLSSSMVKLASDLKYSEQDRGSKIDSSNEVARKNMDESDGSTSASTSASASAVCDEIERSPRWLASARRTFPENYHEPPPSPSPSKFDASSGDLSVYDRTDVLDCQSTIENFIVSDPHIKFNLILAADVICYLGDLLPLFRSIVSILSGSVGSSDGKFAFTIEKSLNSDRDYILGKDTVIFFYFFLFFWNTIHFFFFFTIIKISLTFFFI